MSVRLEALARHKPHPWFVRKEPTTYTSIPPPAFAGQGGPLYTTTTPSPFSMFEARLREDYLSLSPGVHREDRITEPALLSETRKQFSQRFDCHQDWKLASLRLPGLQQEMAEFGY